MHLPEDLTRFAGLTRGQIAALVDAEAELSIGTWSLQEFETALRDAGIALTPDLLRCYADAIAADDPDGAVEWYAALGNTDLRTHLIRHGMLHEADAQLEEYGGEPLSPAELERMGDACFDRGSLEDAYAAYVVASSARGLRNIRRAAVRDGLLAFAERAAEQTGEALSVREYRRCIRAALVRWRGQEVTRIVELIRSHAELASLAPLCVDRATINIQDISMVRRMADDLGVPLTVRHLQRLADQSSWHRVMLPEILAVVEELAERAPQRYAARLPRLLIRGRNWSLAHGYATDAEAYGQRCGAPLTIPELRVYIERYADDDRREEECAFVRGLLIERIGDTVGAPPAAPMHGAAPVSDQRTSTP